MKYRQFSDISRSQKLARLKTIVITALQRYDLDIDTIRFYAEHSNILYTITAKNKKYIMKITRPGDHSFEEIISSLKWLHDVNLKTSINIMKVVPASDGSLAVKIKTPQIEEERYCSLYEWIPGRNMVQNIGKNTAVKWGAITASLHNFSETYNPWKETKVMTWNKVFYWDREIIFSDKYKDLINPRRKEVFRKTISSVQKVLDRLYGGNDQPMLIHGDLHPDNIRRNKSSLYVIDAEDVMWGYPVQDIAIGLMYVRRRENYSEILESYRKGYSSVREWPVESHSDLWALYAGRIMMFANFILSLEDFDEDTEETLQFYEKTFTEYLEKWSK